MKILELKELQIWLLTSDDYTPAEKFKNLQFLVCNKTLEFNVS